jgi:integrase
MQGSVHAYVTRRGENRWRVVFETLPDPLTGVRRQTTKRGFATKKAATSYLRDALTQVEAGTFAGRSRLTLAEYLTGWLDSITKKPTTMADYRQSARVYIIPRIGGVPLQALTPEHLDRLYRELERHGKRAGRCPTAGITCRDHGCAPKHHGGLAPKSVRNVHGMLHRALQDAAERGHVPRNVASLAHPPTARQARSHNTRDKAWDATTLARFLDHVRDHPLYAAWRLAATTGARRGEILGLRWNDVDLHAGTVTFGRQTVTVTGGQVIWQHDGKTDAATRTVALDPATVQALADHRRRQQSDRRAAGPAWHTDSHGPLLFVDPLGRPLRPDSFYRTFVRLARQIDAPELDIHGLRHSYATAALRAGVSPEVLAQRLGHADVSITLNLYAHVRPHDDQAAATLVADSIDGRCRPDMHEQPAVAADAAERHPLPNGP